MSSFVPAPDCVHVETYFTNTNVHTRMDMGFDFSCAAGTPLAYSDCAAIAAAVLTAVNSDLLAVLSDATIFQGVRVTALDTETSPSAFLPDGTHTGAVSGDHLPPQLAAVTKFITGRRGPSGRGRVFMGCLSESQNSAAGELTSAAQTAIHSAITSFIAAIIGSGAGTTYALAHVMLSRYHVTTPGGPAVPRTTAIISPVEEYATDLIIHNQRRRVPRN